jgi:hypothetical protein
MHYHAPVLSRRNFFYLASASIGEFATQSARAEMSIERSDLMSAFTREEVTGTFALYEPVGSPSSMPSGPLGTTCLPRPSKSPIV